MYFYLLQCKYLDQFQKLLNHLQKKITLEIYVSDEYNEFPIYSADEIYNSSTGKWDLVEGGYYVLMNDIELENVVPITTKIGSFDGNNRTISIKNFATNVANGEYGFFANIGEYTSIDATTGLETTKQTILKNQNNKFKLQLKKTNKKKQKKSLPNLKKKQQELNNLQKI